MPERKRKRRNKTPVLPSQGERKQILDFMITQILGDETITDAQLYKRTRAQFPHLAQLSNSYLRQARVSAKDRIKGMSEDSPERIAAEQLEMMRRAQIMAMEDGDWNAIAALNKRISAMLGLDRPISYQIHHEQKILVEHRKEVRAQIMLAVSKLADSLQGLPEDKRQALEAKLTGKVLDEINTIDVKALPSGPPGIRHNRGND